MPSTMGGLSACLQAPARSRTALIEYRVRVITSSPSPSVAKWPVAKAVLDSPPQAVESTRLEHEEHHDDHASRGGLQRGELIGEERRAVLHGVGERRAQRRHQHAE